MIKVACNTELLREYSESPGRTMRCQDSIGSRAPAPDQRRFQARQRTRPANQTLKVKEGLLDAGFLKPIRYAEWVSNIVPVVKIRICIDFRLLHCRKDSGHLCFFLFQARHDGNRLFSLDKQGSDQIE